MIGISEGVHPLFTLAMSSSPKTRPRDDEAESPERAPKRTKVDEGDTGDVPMDTSEDPVKHTDTAIAEAETSPEHAKQGEVMLPPSHSLTSTSLISSTSGLPGEVQARSK